MTTAPISTLSPASYALGVPGRTRLPAIVWILGAVTFVMGTTEMIVAGLLPQVAHGLDVSVPQAGLLITVFALGMVIGTPVMAIATFKLPRKATLVCALVVFSIAHVLAASVADFTLVLATRLVAAVATGTFWAIGAVVASTAAGAAASSRAMGVMVGGVTLSAVLGVPIGTAAGQLWGWQGPMWGLAGLAALCAVMLWRFLPNGVTGTGGPQLSKEIRTLRSPRLWLIYGLTAILQASFIGVYSYISSLLVERAGLPESAVPIAMLLYGIGALTGTAMGARLGDHRPYVVLSSSVVALIVTLAALTLWGNYAPVALGLFPLLGLFGFASNPVLVAETLRMTGGEGVLPVAISNSSFNVGIAAGSALAGAALGSALAEQGPPALGLLLSIASAVPCVILAVTARSSRVSREPEEASAARG